MYAVNNRNYSFMPAQAVCKEKCPGHWGRKPNNMRQYAERIKDYNLGAKVEEKLQNLTEKCFEREENNGIKGQKRFTIIRKMVSRSIGYILWGIMLTAVTKIPTYSAENGHKYAEYGKRLT